MKKTSNIGLRGIQFLSAFLFAILLSSCIWPGQTWGFSFTHALPLPGQFVVCLVLFIIFILPFVKATKSIDYLKLLNPFFRPLYHLPVAVVFGFLFFFFPMVYSGYGDAPFIMTQDDIYVNESMTSLMDGLFNLDLANPKLGGETVIGISASLSYLLGCSAQKAFMLWDAFCGVIFIFFWLRTCQTLIPGKEKWSTPICLLGITSISLFNFFGHFEIYTGILAISMLFLYLAILYLKKKKKWALILMFILAVISLKFHITGFLLITGTLILFLQGKIAKSSKGINWDQALKIFITPLLLLGIALYFILGYDHSPREYVKETMLESAFLPIISTEPAPLDNYSLLNISHLIDFANIFFVWSIAGVVLLFAVLLFNRKQVKWNQPEIIFTGSLLVIYIAFFFALNPLLSMQMDWDLFSIPTTVFIVFIAAIFANLKKDELSPYVQSIVTMSLVVFLTSCYVHQN
ncbi:MAG: hypothetical protein JKY54_12865 [Flavobacteriales bacterium]|nr:hypothetical protein [Flavobacteriales bacterium]